MPAPTVAISITHILDTSRRNMIRTSNFVALQSNSPQLPQFHYGTFAQGVRGLRQHTFVCRLRRCAPGDFAPVGWWSHVDDREALALVDQLLQRHRQGRRTGCERRPKSGRRAGEYYTEHDTRTPVWLCAGDTHTAAQLVGLTDMQRAGGEADTEVVARWLDDGVAPNGECGRAFGPRGVHGFDLTFCAPKTVSLIRALPADEVADKAISTAHATAISEAMEYLAAHAGYTRVHNPVTGEKDLVRLPGFVAIAYEHETSRAGDPHLHTT
jgi:TrwC relaxase